MQVSKWGNSLAVRLPKKLADQLGLREGDEVDFVPAGEKRYAVAKHVRAAAFLDAMQNFRFTLPPGYTFDRDEANER